MEQTSPTQRDTSITERLTTYQRGQRGQRAKAGAGSSRAQAVESEGASLDGHEGERAADAAMLGGSARQIRILRKTAAMAKTGMSESTFDDTRRRDPSFPEAVALGARAIGFFEHELNDWLSRQPRIRVCRVTAESESEA